MTKEDSVLYLGIDVGTGSTRIGAFMADGTMVGTSSRPIRTMQPRAGYSQQSTTDIWSAVSGASRSLLADHDLDPVRVKGIGFDATCSLAVVGQGGTKISVCPDGTAEFDVIVWSDHRAIDQANRIQMTGNVALESVGGSIFPEMQLPKLLWLKQKLPDQFRAAQYFFDLPDWLVYRATGSDIRSLCSATCKWTYQGSRGLNGEGWAASFLTEIGLGDLVSDKFSSIGSAFVAPGSRIGRGLSASAAQSLGLMPGTHVAASLIDAYAGALGTTGVTWPDGLQPEGRLALIAGTSACHIAETRDATFVPGVWGPYLGVLFPEVWANEAGQSAAGALIDRIMNGHCATPDLRARARKNGCNIYDELEELLVALTGSTDDTHLLTANLHVQPDFMGNRAPLADPKRRGSISGLTMQADATDLARQYLATVQALAYGTRQIIGAMRESGIDIRTLVVSGGLARNTLYLREHADATGCAILVPNQQEPVLLGSAMLAATAAGRFEDLGAARAEMSGTAHRILPRTGTVARYHNAKYDVFLAMQSHFADYDQIMSAIRTEVGNER